MRTHRAPRTVGVLALVAVLPLLGGCDRPNMVTQDKAQTWDRSEFFPDHASMRPPVPGTIARDAPGEPVPQPATITAALVTRGRERFDIFCSPCHGRAGDGRGMIVERGFPRPPALGIERLRMASAASLYDVITNGHGAMYSFADRIVPADRWAVVAYLRALQESQNADFASLPAEDRAKLEASP